MKDNFRLLYKSSSNTIYELTHLSMVVLVSIYLQVGFRYKTYLSPGVLGFPPTIAYVLSKAKEIINTLITEQDEQMIPARNVELTPWKSKYFNETNRLYKVHSTKLEAAFHFQICFCGCIWQGYNTLIKLKYHRLLLNFILISPKHYN